LITSALARAQRIDRRLHAFVSLAPSTPIDFGANAFPYAAKDVFASPHRKPNAGLAGPLNIALGDQAEVLLRIDAAGGYCIGFTAMTELAYEPSGFNAVTDFARNPWNPDFIPGGSSSGSAVATASGAVVASLGTDTGGSVRIPSNCCGLTGWKPTWGMVSASGVVPLAPFLDCVGLLARSANDLALAAKVVSLNALLFEDSICDAVVLKDTLAVSELSVRQACQAGIDAIRASGVRLREIDGLSAIGSIDKHALIVMQGEAARTHADHLDDEAIGSTLRKRLGKGLEIDDATLNASRVARQQLAADFIDQILGAADIALLPVMPIRTPPYSDVDPSSSSFSGRRLYDLSRYCRFVNMLGFPAVVIPVGFDDHGLPVGLQLIGRPGQDGALIALATKVQEKTDWHARIPNAVNDLVSIDKELFE
jgi:aspartyl-tRNA(Asn)/glutamyl-tRNA(Gln) amidotransferase subunit A